MSRIEKQKRVADIILEKLTAVDPYAIVAGGAPRDWYFNKEATDIDVYIHVSLNVLNKDVKRQIEVCGFTVLSEKDGKNIPEDYKLNPNIRTVINTTLEGEDIQIMVMLKPTFDSVVDKFAVSLSKIWYKNGKVNITKDFEISVKHSVMYKCSDLYGDSHKYIQKLKNKFPEFKYFASKSEMVDYVL